MRAPLRLLPFFLFAAAAAHASDTSAPTVVQWSIPALPQPADAGLGNLFFEASVTISDAGGSGANFAEMVFARKANDGQWEFQDRFLSQEILAAHRSTGDGNLGSYRVRVRIPEGTAPGNYFLHSLKVYDAAGNHSDYFADASGTGEMALPPEASTALVVTRSSVTKPVPPGGWDAVPPSITAVAVNATWADVENEAGFVYFTIDADDATSGLAFIDAWLVSPDGTMFSEGRGSGASSALVSGSLVNGAYALRVRIPQGAPVGYWTVGGILAVDAAGNIAFQRPNLRVAVTSGDNDGDGRGGDADAFPFDGTEWADNDGDGIGDNADPDDDNDGLPDEWEILAETNPFSVDTDGDGFWDSAEVDAGMEPLSPDSTPARQASVELNPATTQFAFRFFSKSGATYRIETSTDLKDWRTAIETMAGTGQQITLQLATDGSAQLFVRAVELP